jgi:TolB-like protein
MTLYFVSCYQQCMNHAVISNDTTPYTQQVMQFCTSMIGSKDNIITACIGFVAIAGGILQGLSTLVEAFQIPVSILMWVCIVFVFIFPMYLYVCITNPNFLLTVTHFIQVATTWSMRSKGKKKIVITTFKNVRKGLPTDILSDSLPETILSALVRSGKFSIQLDSHGEIAHKDMETIGVFARKQHIDALLTGSILSIGNEVSVTVKLILFPSNSVAWTESTRHKLENIFNLQDSITSQIQQSLEKALQLQHH